MPASYAPALLVATVAATVSLMGVGAFACVLLPLPLTVTGLMLLKGLVCACGRGRRRVHHDLLRRALRQKRGLSVGYRVPVPCLGRAGIARVRRIDAPGRRGMPRVSFLCHGVGDV